MLMIVRDFEAEVARRHAPGHADMSAFLKAVEASVLTLQQEEEDVNVAAAVALETLKRPCRVVVHTDSEYLRNGITRWHTGWVRKGWRNAAGDPVANMDLWRRILDAAKPHEIDWKWVRGHSGNPMNERADVLATEARRTLGGG